MATKSMALMVVSLLAVLHQVFSSPNIVLLFADDVSGITLYYDLYCWPGYSCSGYETTYV